jgi:serine protease Do
MCPRFHRPFPNAPVRQRGTTRVGTSVALLAAAFCIAAAHFASAANPPAAPPAEAAPTPTDTSTASEGPDAVDEEFLTQPLSNAARTRLERARDSVVQIRGFFGESESDAFHGTGFAVGNGLIVTNYHVVSDAVLYPKRYRLEYLDSNGAHGRLAVHAFDLEHDLAVVAADGYAPPPMRLRKSIPNKGERAYSIGFPLNLGLTITEGVANGLVENTLEQRIHYSGAMNPGMSGGPAIDASGAVYGVNVSVLTGGQSVSFVVPAKHIDALLKRATAPLPADARGEVERQLLEHQASLFASIPVDLAMHVANGYSLPAKIAPAFNCNSSGTADANQPVRIETVNCVARVGVYVQKGLDTGDVQILHRILQTDRLHPLQFADRVNRSAEVLLWGGSDQHVAPFVCKNEVVALDGFDARVGVCLRQYRMFGSLYDMALSVVSLNQDRVAFVTDARLRGVSYETGMAFAKRFLGAMQWKP